MEAKKVNRWVIFFTFRPTFDIVELKSLLHLSDLFKAGYISNAYSPLVWKCAISFFILGFLMLQFKNDLIIRYTCFGLIIFLVIYASRMYFVLYKKDPKLLQSEYYRLEDKKLDMMATEDHKSPVLAEETTQPIGLIQK